MKPKYIIPSILVLAFIFSPASPQESVFTFPFENEIRLPAMNTHINTDEIFSTYQTYGNIYKTEITGLGENSMEQTSMSFISDAKVVDALRYLEYYLDEQLIDQDAEKLGLVDMSVIYFNESHRFSVGSVFGILTLGIATLFGMPFSKNITDVEIEAAFYNNEEYLISKYRGVGRGKTSQSIFSFSTRKAHQKALKDALEDLNLQIMGDSNLLSGQGSFQSHP